MQLYNYTETESDIVLFIEYCNDAKYFETQLEENKKEIKDEVKLKNYAY